jgi:hypothetical protein
MHVGITIHVTYMQGRGFMTFCREDPFVVNYLSGLQCPSYRGGGRGQIPPGVTRKCVFHTDFALNIPKKWCFALPPDSLSPPPHDQNPSLGLGCSKVVQKFLSSILAYGS